MRSLIFSLFLVAFTGGLFSCDDNKKSDKVKNNVTLMKANWSDTTTLGKVINQYYKDSVIKKGKIALELRDPTLKSSHPYQYLQLHKVYRPQLKLSSEKIGYMPVLMMDGGDSAIVDFQIKWEQPNPTDSIGEFVVSEVLLRSIGQQARYKWKQEGEYWIRESIEVGNTRNSK